MRKGLLFDEFFEETYLPVIKRWKRSWAIDERVWRQYLSQKFGKRPVREITGNEVADWRRQLAEAGLAPATCNRYLAVLRSIFALAVVRGLIEKSPCENVRRFKEPTGRERFLTEEAGKRLLAHLSASHRPEARAISLLLLTGARKREILNARWDDVDFERRILTVRVSKSNRARHIPLSSRAMTVLRAIPIDSAWIFPNRKRSGPLADVYLFWNGVREALGLQGYRIHDLRHSFASYLVNSGHSLYVVQRTLGHSSPAMTTRYAHLADSALHRCVEAVGALLGSRRRGNAESRSIWRRRERKIIRLARQKGAANEHFL